ncbi:MAG: glycosyltransferase family 2 protein [Smithella sp.]|jgi:GT2 family glycosyltransferase
MNKCKKEVIKNKPLISLILVTMNRKELLRRCLESILLQKFADYEIIVVDNASTDGTGDMVQSMFPYVRYFYLSKNLGVPGGRNYGVQMSTGEFCVFLDDDAIFADVEVLNRLVSYLQSDSSLGCIAFRIVKPSDGLEEYKSIPRADKKIINEDYECSYFCGAGFAVKREIFLKIGMFWEHLFFIGEELDFSYRMLDKGYKILRSSAISVIHYETPQARIQGKWIYFGMRSRFWIALRNLPWRYAVPYTFLWWGYYFILSLRHRHLIYFIQGVKDALAGWPRAMRSRRCISGETINKLKKLSGRIYY